MVKDDRGEQDALYKGHKKIASSQKVNANAINVFTFLFVKAIISLTNEHLFFYQFFNDSDNIIKHIS